MEIILLILLLFLILFARKIKRIAIEKGYNGNTAMTWTIIGGGIPALIYFLLPEKFYYCRVNNCGERNHHSRTSCIRCDAPLPHAQQYATARPAQPHPFDLSRRHSK